MTITIRSNERTFITGKTGSGKTYLARALCENFDRLIVIDSKANLRKAFRLQRDTRKARRALYNNRDVRLQIVPPILRATELREYYNELFQELYELGDLVVYIDELYAVTQTSHYEIPYLTAIYTRGRERGIGIIACSQRPRFVPNYTLSESEHLFVFRLTLSEDRERLERIAGRVLAIDARDEHGFWYVNSLTNAAHYFRSYKS